MIVKTPLKFIILQANTKSLKNIYKILKLSDGFTGTPKVVKNVIKLSINKNNIPMYIYSKAVLVNKINHYIYKNNLRKK